MNIPSLLSLNYPTHVAATQASRGHTVTKRKHSKYEASESNPFLLQDFKIRFQKVRSLSCVCVCVGMRAVYLSSLGELCVSPSLYTLEDPPAVVVYVHTPRTASLSISAWPF